ncbi:MAG: hypothetical protein E6G28_01965 [Actinobacteria bacterium]|nr:MAG: hypothetical protein E6G28_01965 [Actinomycetota bacterium]
MPFIDVKLFDHRVTEESVPKMIEALIAPTRRRKERASTVELAHRSQLVEDAERRFRGRTGLVLGIAGPECLGEQEGRQRLLPARFQRSESVAGSCQRLPGELRIAACKSRPALEPVGVQR